MKKKKEKYPIELFESKYNPISDENGIVIYDDRKVVSETVNELFQDTGISKGYYVWTLQDFENSTRIYPGWHIVNVVGYMITNTPWTDADADVSYKF